MHVTCLGALPTDDDNDGQLLTAQALWQSTANESKINMQHLLLNYVNHYR